MTAKLLIVDDAETIRSFESMILENSGYQIAYAKNGAEALLALRDETPDLVLLDIEMPIMDGIECCRQIKQDKRFKDVKVVMVTTRSEYSKISEAFAAGADDYIVKPIDPKELREKVKELLKFTILRKLMAT